MSRDSQKPAPRPAAGQATAGQADPRRERLARALRDNLKKRKAQQRERRAGPEPIAGGGEDSSGGGA
jgi:hypothetical protein